jgi:multisubunit Na+/H+ antiporter MnhF subunit
VNVWLWGATALLLGLVACGWLALRASTVDALVALQVGGALTTLTLILLSEGFNRASYMSLAVAAPFLGFVGILFTSRFLTRHL